MKKIWSRTLRPGEKWSGNIGRGKYIHFKALGDDANVSMLMYNMLDTSERYNMPDTLKAQFISSLTKGNVLMSDNGRVLASIVRTALDGMIRSQDIRQGFLPMKNTERQLTRR